MSSLRHAYTELMKRNAFTKHKHSIANPGDHQYLLVSHSNIQKEGKIPFHGPDSFMSQSKWVYQPWTLHEPLQNAYGCGLGHSAKMYPASACTNYDAKPLVRTQKSVHKRRLMIERQWSLRLSATMENCINIRTTGLDNLMRFCYVINHNDSVACYWDYLSISWLA